MFLRLLFTALALSLAIGLSAQTVIQTQSAMSISSAKTGMEMDDDDEQLLPQEVEGDRNALISSGKIPATATPHWYKMECAFDSVPVGQPIECVYKLRNVGGSPLIISDVKARNAAIKIEYPQSPVTTGAYGEIRVTYTPEAAGKFAEYLTVFTNAEDNTAQLSFLGLAIQP